MTVPYCHKHFRTAALCAAVLLFLLSTSCRKKGNDMIPNFEDRSKVPGMWLDSVTTLISDSGVIRYKIVTEKWEAFDKADDPYWFFPERLHFERFNDTLVIESVVDCDTAWYYYDRKVWVLKQNVFIRNTSGETFETTLMNWDQDSHRVYSDTSFIRIRQSHQEITGRGFESNESMTNYTVHEIGGMFPIDKEDTGEDTGEDIKEDTEADIKEDTKANIKADIKADTKEGRLAVDAAADPPEKKTFLKKTLKQAEN